jgi:hypothetical protein
VAPSSGVSFVSVNEAGIQNGGSDGIALVDNSNNVVQFISYEGTVTASNGPASGKIFTDVADPELLRELNLDVSTEELLSAERAFTYVPPFT